MIAALYIETDGCYSGLAGVDPWDIGRDARLYSGPWPVVAHPPCDRWCQMAPVNQARYGHKIGDDGGFPNHSPFPHLDWGRNGESPIIRHCLQTPTTTLLLGRAPLPWRWFNTVYFEMER